MAHRKQVAQPRTCAQCPVVFLTARKGHVYCSSACSTRAWRARQPASTTTTSLATRPPTAPPEPPPAAPAVNVALSPQSISTVAVGTVVGNAITAFLTHVFAGPAQPAPPRHQPFPTWPPAALLAAAGPPGWVEDPAWTGRRWLVPTTYHGHSLHLYAEAGMPYVLWQLSSGEWRLLTSPADLAQLAQQKPVPSALRTLLRQHGVAVEPVLVGEPLFDVGAPPNTPKQLG
jgi:hypothetical protein